MLTLKFVSDIFFHFYVPFQDKPDDVEKQELTEGDIGWFDTLVRNRMAVSGLIVFIIVVILIIVALLTGKKYVPVSPPLENNKYITAVTSCGKVQG